LDPRIDRGARRDDRADAAWKSRTEPVGAASDIRDVPDRRKVAWVHIAKRERTQWLAGQRLNSFLGRGIENLAQCALFGFAGLGARRGLDELAAGLSFAALDLGLDQIDITRSPGDRPRKRLIASDVCAINDPPSPLKAGR
jgi:hypothetical protein